jgi:tRNA1(Val) A37 N6-methylase TrmN6
MHFEPLGRGIEVCVNDLHRFNTDTILLAHFAAPKKDERIVELGSGCGTIPLLIVRDSEPRVIHAVEIQEEAVGLLKKGILQNLNKGIEDVRRIRPVPGDIRQIKKLLPAGESDLVICNPPYKQAGAGIENPDGQKRIARHEAECTLDDICDAARWLLRFGGRFVMCQRPERLADVIVALRAHDLEPKRLRMVQGRLEKAPKLFLIEAKRGAKPGYMDVMPALIVEDENGFTSEMNAIYGIYKDEHENG